MLNCVQLHACALATAIFAAYLTTKTTADIPNQVVLTAEASTVDSVCATWTKSEGGVSGYEIECSEGVATPPSINQSDFHPGPFTASCLNVTNPGDVYIMVVYRIKDGSRWPPANISLTALPNSPVLDEGPEAVSSVSATWTKPQGVVTAYAIGCNKGDAMPLIIPQTGDGPFSASCVNLVTPGDQYIMNVTSLSGDQRSHRADIFLRAAPSPVTDLSELTATNDSVSATWTKPPGVVDSYTVICDGSSIFVPEKNNGSTHTVTCTGLKDPEGSYTIVVFARSSGKVSVGAVVTITLNPDPPGPDTSTHIMHTFDSTTTSAIPATTDGVSATTSATTSPTTAATTAATIAATTMDRAVPTSVPSLGLQYIIIIVVLAILLILLIVVALLALLILRHRMKKRPSETDRTPLEATSHHINSVYQEIDEVPAPPSNIYDDIGDRTRDGSSENIYLEPDGTGRGDHTTGLNGASGGISESIKGKSKEEKDAGGVFAKNNDYVDLPVHGGMQDTASIKKT